MMAREIIVAHGLCSAIRPKVLTALPPEQYPNLRIAAWATGQYGKPETANVRGPDADAWAQRHFAAITVPGDESFAKWIEYVLCRYMAANPGVGMVLLSKPLEKRNAGWAARYTDLPPANDWRQQGCTVRLPKAATKGSAEQQRAAAWQPAKAARRKQPATRRGWLATLRRLW